MRHKAEKKLKDKKSLVIRVGAGKFKGRRIECPPGEIRPLTSKVKEALFNIVQPRKNMKMLDVFSGSASISIEAFSRDVIDSVDIVEGDFGKREILENNIKLSDMSDIANVYISDAFNYIRHCDKQYDFIMLDPPFKMTNKQELLELIDKKELLADGGFIVMHLPRKDSMDEEIGNLYRYDYREYGLNAIMFYKKSNV